MLTGSFASSFLGRPRSTHDIDLVVDLPRRAAPLTLLEFREPDFYLSDIAVQEAIATEGMFNLIQIGTADKVDFWILKDNPLDQLAFSRRFRAEFRGDHYWFPRPEELILLKLPWYALSGQSGQQFDDALGVLRLQHDVLDLAHLDYWAMRTGLSPLLQDLRARAGI